VTPKTYRVFLIEFASKKLDNIKRNSGELNMPYAVYVCSDGFKNFGKRAVLSGVSDGSNITQSAIGGKIPGERGRVYSLPPARFFGSAWIGFG
jgi:hypothetical protein